MIGQINVHILYTILGSHDDGVGENLTENLWLITYNYVSQIYVKMPKLGEESANLDPP